MVKWKPSVPTTTGRALCWSGGVGLVTFVVLLLMGFGSGIWGLTRIASRFAPPTLDTAVWTLVGTLLMVGVPTALYLWCGLLSPLVVLILEFILWSLFTQGAVWFFAVFLWPAYLVIYLIGGGIEYLLRTRGPLSALPSARQSERPNR